jgi:hypothetical protein
MYRATLAAEGFADAQLHTLAIDVGFLIYKYPEKNTPTECKRKMCRSQLQPHCRHFNLR